MATTSTTSGHTFSGIVGSGNTQIIEAGATASGAIASGGQIIASNGANFASNTILAGGTATIYCGNGPYAANGSGGQAGGNIVSSGGLLIIGSGGDTSDDIATGGGVISFGSGALNTYGPETAISGGQVLLGSGSYTGNAGRRVVASAGGIAIFQSGASFKSASEASVAASGGRIIWESGSVLNGSRVVTVSSGGVLEVVNGAYFDDAAATMTTGGMIDFNQASKLSNLDNVSAVYNGSRINLQSAGNTLAYMNVVFNGVTVSSGQVFAVRRDAYDQGAVMDVCYLGGTIVEMADGYGRAVEDIRIGDRVKTFADGVEGSETVTWVGSKVATVNPAQPVDLAGYPIRIVQDALDIGVPNKDLLVTPEHCLYLDGAFVPARMLVNDSSIYYDTSFVSFAYYHVETEKHAVIRADGALAETYLDTGNRHSFQQNGTVAILNGPVKNWADDAAAPLRTDRAFVEALSRRLAAQAGAQVGAADTTQAHGLTLLLPDGRMLSPVREKNGHLTFSLPAGTSHVVLLSNAARPSDTIGPFMDDRRTLGVLIGKVRLWGDTLTHTIDNHLVSDHAGWLGREASACRWTNGAATLPLPALPRQGLLTLEVRAAGPYRVRPRDVAA